MHGLNPYAHTPRAARGDSVFAHVDWKGVTSVYGPLFTLATYSLAKLPVDTAVLALKAVSAVSTLALALIVARIAPARGVDPVRAAAFVALNPLVLVHVVGGPHNDVLAMAFAMLAAGATLAVAEGWRPAPASSSPWPSRPRPDSRPPSPCSAPRAAAAHRCSAPWRLPCRSRSSPRSSSAGTG